MYDAIIIGAGFAGLAAARKLTQEGCTKVLVLEARDRVGGRTMHGVVAGLDVDFGGMWLGPTQTRLATLAQEYQVRTYRTFLEGKAVFRLNGKEHHGDRENIDGIFGARDALSYFSVRRKIKALSAEIDCEEPWAHRKAEELDATTVEQWVCAKIKSERLRQLYRLLCFSLFCAEASQVSMLFFLHYLKSGDGFNVLISADEGGAQNFLFHGGVHQIARKMSEELGDRVRLEEPVSAIEWSDDRATVRTTKGQYDAKRVIVCVPPTLVAKLDFSPPLPQPKAALHNRLIMGSAIKYWVVFDRPFWRDQGFNGSIIRDDVPCAPCFDVTPAGEERGVIAGFFDGDHALNHGDAPKEVRKDLVLKMLAEHFGDKALSPVEYVDQDWTAETWSGGCYGAFAAPGIYAKFGAWLRRPIGPLLWAGTETSPRWTGYIDGAIRSGERAADEVLQATAARVAPLEVS